MTEHHAADGVPGRRGIDTRVLFGSRSTGPDGPIAAVRTTQWFT